MPFNPENLQQRDEAELKPESELRPAKITTEQLNLEDAIEGFNKQLEIDKKTKAIDLVTKINELKFGAETKEDYEQLTKLFKQLEGLYRAGEISDSETIITTALEQALKEGADKNNVDMGLDGVDTPEFIALRNYVAHGLAGVGTPESMALRERLLKEGVDESYVALGLAGVGTPESMTLRDRLLKEGADKGNVAKGLAGVGTPESMALRERLLKEGADRGSVAWGLAGVSTPESMALRERLLKEGAGKGYVAYGLAGVSNPESMALRERLLKEGIDKDYVARGLAGVITKEAQEFREKYFGDNPTLLAKSYSTGWTDYDGIICRYGYEGD